MRYLCALLFALWPLASAASDPAGMAARAAAELDQAALALQGADGARDRVDALTRIVRAYESGLSALREGLRLATLRERALSENFAAEQDRLGRLLGALQSMQSSPETLLLLHPSGALDSARAGMLISDVVPAVEAEAAQLRERLQEVVALRAIQASGLATLEEGLIGVQSARSALSLAIAERRPPTDNVETDNAAMQALINSAETLSAFASSLGFEGVEADGESFRDAQGVLAWPATGTPLRGFNEADASGTRRPGLILATGTQALVSAPWSGTVRYSGPLLDYGNVMILEPEIGYLLVLAGLGGVYAAQGDIVAKGDALALMGGDPSGARENLDDLSRGRGPGQEETLYIELRVGNKPVDPEPWFLRARTEED
ncbi:MAG: peptidoglycan DD-metalloendopeptidase family protein [Pseudomonadota bacterium]